MSKPSCACPGLWSSAGTLGEESQSVGLTRRGGDRKVVPRLSGRALLRGWTTSPVGPSRVSRENPKALEEEGRSGVYAIVRSGGRQHKVAVGDILDIDLVSEGSAKPSTCSRCCWSMAAP